MDDIEKTLENLANVQKGNTLALQAIAETLDGLNPVISKMLKKQEDDEKKEEEEKKEQAEEEKMEKMVSAIADRIAKEYNLKKEDISNVPGKGPDSNEEPAQLPAPELDQEPIGEAGVNANEGQKPVVDNSENDQPGDPDDPKERPQDDIEKGEVGEVAQLKKQLDEMKKGMEEAVEKQVRDRLAKSGWREESGLSAPKSVSSNVADGVGTPLIKGDETQGELIKKLCTKSRKELRQMQERAYSELSDNKGLFPGAWTIDDLD